MRPRPRYTRMVWRLLITLGAMIAAFGALAQTSPRPEALIKWRQSAFQVIAWNSGRIKTALAGEYDAQEVQAAANALAAVASAGLGNLFAPGTADGKGWRETAARDEVFGDTENFRTLTAEFARETTALARLAAGRDREAVRTQFVKVAQGCKSCHDRYRNTD